MRHAPQHDLHISVQTVHALFTCILTLQRGLLQTHHFSHTLTSACIYNGCTFTSMFLFALILSTQMHTLDAPTVSQVSLTYPCYIKTYKQNPYTHFHKSLEFTGCMAHGVHRGYRFIINAYNVIIHSN